MKYYEWIAQCCKELNWDVREGADLVKDVNWFACYDDGMTSKNAVDEAVRKGIVERRNFN